MARIFADITKTIGNTPLVRVNKLTKGLKATVNKYYFDIQDSLSYTLSTL